MECFSKGFNTKVIGLMNLTRWKKSVPGGQVPHMCSHTYYFPVELQTESSIFLRFSKVLQGRAASKMKLEAREGRKPCVSKGSNDKMVGLRSLARLKKSRPGCPEAQQI